MLACRPMVPLAIAVAAGALAARFFPPLAEYAAIGLILFAAALARFCLGRAAAAPPPPPETIPPRYLPHILPAPGFIARRGRNAFFLLLCAGCFFLAAWRQGAWRERLDPARLPRGPWREATLLADAPNARQNQSGVSGEWRVPARLASLDGADGGLFPVRLYGTAKEAFQRGDRLSGRVRLSLPRPPAFPGAFDSAFWLEREGLGAYATAARGGGDAFRIIPETAPSLFTGIRRAVDAVRARAIAATLACGGEHGPLLAAMLYGHRAELPAGLTNAFRRVGIGHVLAISGLHVGLVVAVLWGLTGRLPWAVRGRSLACLAATIVYLGLSGGQVAAARATLMAVIHLGTLAVGRRGDMLNSLGAAAFLIILHNPAAPLDVGFQLSFTAVAFIFIAFRNWGLGPGRAGREFAPRPDASPLRTRLRSGLLSLISLSAATWAGLYPISAFVFRQVNLVALPVNVVVIPLTGAVLVGGLLLPVAGWIPGAAFLLTLPSRALTRIAFAADAIPYSSFPAHPPSGGWMAVFYLFVFLYLLNRMFARPAARRRWLAFCCSGLALGLLGTTASMRSLPPPPEGRLSLLPGTGLGVVAAETPDGRIALVGQIRGQGLDESAWLHALRREGPVSVVTLGRGRRGAPEGLAFHYPPVALINFPLTAKKEANAPPGWRPVPEAPGVVYALVRNDRGRATALIVRAGGRLIATASRPGADDAAALAAFLRENREEGLSSYLCLGHAERRLLADGDFFPADWIGVRGDPGAALPEGWRAQSAAGAVVFDSEPLEYDGRAWRSFPSAIRR